MKKTLNNSVMLSLEELEGLENEALARIVSSLKSGRTESMSHQSHSSSSGRGHTSYVSGTGHSEKGESK